MVAAVGTCTALWLRSCCRHLRGGSKTPTTRGDAGLTIRQPSRSVLSLCFKVAGAPLNIGRTLTVHALIGDIHTNAISYFSAARRKSKQMRLYTHLRDRGCPGSRPTAPPLLLEPPPNVRRLPVYRSEAGCSGPASGPRVAAGIYPTRLPPVRRHSSQAGIKERL